MTDLASLETAASKTRAAVDAERERLAGLEAAAAAEVRERSIQWGWDYVVSYGTRQGAAGERVTALLASLTEAITTDMALSARLYLAAVTEMAKANRLGEDLVRARAILAAAGKLPGVYLPGREPTGANAPYLLTSGAPRFPSFIEFVSEALDAQRARASHVQSGEAPESFEGTASEGMQREALRREFVLSQEWESLLAIKAQYPARFAQLPPEQQTAILAYEATREAAGYEGELPKIVVEGPRAAAPPVFGPTDTTRIRLYGAEHAPRPR